MSHSRSLATAFACATAICMLLVAPAATALTQTETKPSPKWAARGEQVTLTRPNGFVVRGHVVSMNSRELTINDGKRTFTITGKEIKTIQTSGDSFTWNREKQTFESAKVLAEEARQVRIAEEAKARQTRIAEEAKRSGEVKFINKTGHSVEVIVTGLRDKEGNEFTLASDTSKSNLERFAEIFSDKNEPGPKRWTFDPYDTAYLKDGDTRLKTSKLSYTLKTSDGARSWVVEKKKDGPDFVITIDQNDLHSPVLAKIGKWTVEQDISYTTHRARTPTTIHPVKGFFSGKIEYYEVLGGDEYDYTRENRSGTATAWAEVENPTDRALEVSATVEFHFTHLLLSNEQVTATISVKPKTRTKMYINVDTLALIGNRKATGVSIIDVTTTPK